MPAPSGPRCDIASRMRTRYGAVTSNELLFKVRIPAMPHMEAKDSLFAYRFTQIIDRQPGLLAERLGGLNFPWSPIQILLSG